MNKKLPLLFLGLVMCFAAAAQQLITGKVTSAENGEPVPGVTVTVKGASTGTQTDQDGNYEIAAEEGQVLVFSFLGMETVELAVGSSNTLDVSMELQAQSLEEVVVVGYGTQTKANLTGAVSTVDVEKTFESRPLTDPSKALQGVVPGLTITYGNGGLTTAPTTRIRGIGSINGPSAPLILVDNIETPDLTYINPNDIKSISVLKDAASTSIYGARAAFGVILITTKSGTRNRPTTIGYSNNFSWSKPTVLPDFADPEFELQALYDASRRSGITSPEIFGMQLQTLREGIINWKENYANTNTGVEMVNGEDFEFNADEGRVYFYRVWDAKDRMLKDHTNEQQHNLNVQGGSEKIGYYLSAGANDAGGIMKLNPDNVTKYNITASVNAAATKWLDVDGQMLYRNFKYEYPFEYQGYWYYFWRWGAYFPYGTYDGNYFRHTPAYLAGAQTSDVTSNFSRINLGATAELSDNLSIRAAYTIDRDNVMRHEVGGDIMAWDFWGGIPQAPTNIATASQDRVSYGSSRHLRNVLNAYATFQDTLAGNHHFKLTAGVNAEDFENIGFSAERRGILDPEKGELPLAVGDQFASGNRAKGSYAGYFARINYNFKNKYLLEVNGRYDGSSSFSPEDRWAFFPSFSAGYRISEEDFMENLKPALYDLKLRVSYGSLGNQNVGGNFYIPTMDNSTVNWIAGSNAVQGIEAPIAVANSLTWEKVTKLDIGADIRLFDNRAGITFDWFQNVTTGMLNNTAVPETFGTGGPVINAGDFRTRGWEVSLDFMQEITNNFQLYGILTLTDMKTVFTKWDNPSFLISQHYEGKTYGEIWGFETDRYFTEDDPQELFDAQENLQTGNFEYGPGDVKFKDLNGDGVINGGATTLHDHGDLKVIGNTQPRYQYGARIGGAWKNLDFDVFIQGVGKRDLWGAGDIALPLYRGGDILYAHQLDYWTPENADARYPRHFVGNSSGNISGLENGGHNFYPQSKYLLNLAYCRLKNVTIGYSLSPEILNKVNLRKVRLYISGENLAEISDVGVPLDPEITDGELGFLGRTFPFQRRFSFGLQVTL